jgi:uncharacterized membrane protein YhhN
MMQTIPARLLNALIVASAMLAIAAGPWALDQRVLLYVFKPLTTILILLRAWPRGSDSPAARRTLLLGLLLSLLGDVALLWPQQGFLPGLVAFLFAHIAYTVAFTREHRFLAQPAALAAYALFAGAILAFLWSFVPPGLRIPVACYVLALTAMSAQTAVIGLSAGSEAARRNRLLMLGGALFMASDALLAINKFAQPIPASSLWVLATYWAAQWCIASWLRPAPTLTAFAAPRGGSAG